MAPQAAKKAVAPPSTLPPDFNQWDGSGVAPGTLPADFDKFDKQAEEKQNYDNAPQGNSGFFGPIQDAYDDAEKAPQQKMSSPAGIHGLGPQMLGAMARGVGDLAYPLIHPVKTAESLPHAMVGPHGFGLADTLVSGLAHDVHDNPGEAIPRFMGQMAGGELASGAGEAARAVGAPMERVGMGAVNDALGARGPKPFQYGHNPARGAIEEGVVPSLSKHSASMKVKPAMSRVGGDIAGSVSTSTATIPSADVARVIRAPLLDAENVTMGPGGTQSTAPLTKLGTSMQRVAPGANAPVFGSAAPADIPPSDLWHTIRNIDENTRFNPDPEVEGVNEVRRGVRSGLRGELEKAVPDIAESSRTYGDLAGARDALDRTMHSGTPLHKLLDSTKFPLETAGGVGLVKMGRGLKKIDPRLLRTMAIPGMTKENQ